MASITMIRPIRMVMAASIISMRMARGILMIMTTGTITGMATSTDTPGMETGRLYRLLAWLSPSYPIGAFSYSHGLEFAIESGWVKDRATLETWLAHVLSHGAAWIDAVLLREAMRAGEARLDELADLASAWRGSSEMALETTQQGGSFLSITRAAWPHPALDAFAARREGRPLALPIALGAAAAAHGLRAEDVVAGYLHAFAANQVSAALRLVPLGQTDGQKALAALLPVIEALLPRALAQDIDALASAAPMVDIASMRHETQYTRLFRS